jgi:hypothetical protein
VIQLGDQQPFRFLIHDRDAKLSHAFDEIFRSEDIWVIRTPIQAPNANAHAERWARTLGADCLDRILILGRRHLERRQRLSRNGEFVLAEAWSPNARTIAYLAGTSGYGGSAATNLRLRIVTADGKRARTLAHDSASVRLCGFCTTPAWTPDGERILVVESP